MTPEDLRASPTAPLSWARTSREVLGGDVLVAELLGLVLGLVRSEEPLAHPRAGLAALDLGEPLQRLVDPAGDELGVGADAAEEGLGHTLLLLEEGLGQVLGLEIGGAHAAGQRLPGLEGLLRLDGELFDAHDPLP